MTDAAPAPRIGLQTLGDPSAAACEGDFCEIPASVTAAAHDASSSE